MKKKLLCLLLALLLVLPLASLGICLALNVSHDLTLVLLIAASAPPAGTEQRSALSITRDPRRRSSSLRSPIAEDTDAFLREFEQTSSAKLSDL